MSVAHIHPKYDIIVVGAGIAGLHVADKLARRHPSWSVAVLEKYKTLGGRAFTYAPKPYRANEKTDSCESLACSSSVFWEAGAGRVHSSHKRLHALLKKYGISTIGIGSEIGYMSKPGEAVMPNIFENAILPIFVAPLRRLGDELLSRHTLAELLDRVFGRERAGKLMNWFPYKSEFATQRADVALDAFFGEGSVASNTGYSVLAEGFSELVARMVAGLPSNVVVLRRHTVSDLSPGPGGSTDLTVLYGENKKILLRAGRACIMAVHSAGLRAITPFQTYAPLRYLKTEPLLRIYMKFPEAWFKGLGRVVFPEGLRYMIPVDEAKGVVMISYTDSTDTKHYSELVERYGDESVQVRRAVMRDVRRWFPAIRIPEPVYTKAHYWSVGTTYWLPLKRGEPYKSVETLSNTIRHPFPRTMPGVYVCGESYSAHNQAWVEGALETADATLKDIFDIRM